MYTYIITGVTGYIGSVLTNYIRKSKPKARIIALVRNIEKANLDLRLKKMRNRKFSYCSGINGHYEIALSVEDYAAVDRTYLAVTEAGAKGIMEPATEPWGQRTCYIADPEGNLIEIGSFTEG